MFYNNNIRLISSIPSIDLNIEEWEKSVEINDNMNQYQALK